MAKKINTDVRSRSVNDDTLQHEAEDATTKSPEMLSEHSEKAQNRTEMSVPKPKKQAQDNCPGAQTSDVHLLQLLKKFPAYPLLYIDAHGGIFTPDTAATIRGKATLYHNPFYNESKN